METIKLRSSIKPTLKRKVLMRGTLIAGLGGIILLYCGVFTPAETLEQWGMIPFLLAVILITVGLLPYRKLTRLETTPHEIVGYTNDRLDVFLKKRKRHSIPLDAIEGLHYIEKKDRYGIELYTAEGNLFLPYFSERACRSLREWLSDLET